jgi:hypothetical protein
LRCLSGHFRIFGWGICHAALPTIACGKDQLRTGSAVVSVEARMGSKLAKRIGTMAFLSLALAAFTSCRTNAMLHGGWRPLFDGRSTDGWQMVGPGELKLERDELVTYGGMGLLWYTREKLGNCRIRVMFKPTLRDDNSGVFIRIPQPPRDPWDAVHHGYEVQIENRADEWHRTGCLYSISRARRIVNARVNEWNLMLITLDGNRTRVELNGALVTDYVEGDPVPPKTEDHEPERGPRPETGYIGLQNHGGEARVHFREVSVAALR